MTEEGPQQIGPTVKKVMEGLETGEEKGDLIVAESFYTLQCEGVSNGVPAYFVRLKNCNLICGGTMGTLMKKGRASWYCDTEPVWRQGQELTNEQLEQRIVDAGQLENVLNGTTHLIWTGGEPTLPKSRRAIRSFLDYMDAKHFGHGRFHNRIYNEIETNGTVQVEDDFYQKYIHQINCSPKLANSGMPEKIRINPNSIPQIRDTPNSWFKFVISEESDMEEIRASYLDPFKIPARQVVLMPGLDSQEHYFERTKFVYEMGKKYGMRAVSRGHIAAWDKTTGV